MFMDSTGNVDRHSCRVFLLMTHSAAGVLPVGCFLTTSETHTSIEGAFSLYKSMLMPDSFGGRGLAGPRVMMTDDSDVERSATKASFPATIPLLCMFHVLQATWRWLWNAKHGIPQIDRPEMFSLVKQLMYCTTAEAFEDIYTSGIESAVMERHVAFQSYVTALYVRKEIWTLAYRDTLLVRGNNTNNFCEAAMRVLKENALNRTKAFNVIQLFDFIVTRILDVANNRVSDPRSRYVMEVADVDKQQVHKVGRTVYTQPCASVAGATYTVDMDVGLCTCPVGRTGCGCKHQAAEAHMYKLTTTNQMPQFSPHMRRLLYCVATGKPAAVTQSFFALLNEDNERMVVNNTTVDDDDAREGYDGDGIRWRLS